jgi:ABC-2 type transport system permease protein
MEIMNISGIMKKFPNIGTIFKKEMRSYFNSAIAYVIIVVFLGLVGWFYVNNIFLINQATMRDMFGVLPIFFLFIIPALTMRLFSEEKKSGTIELLTTKPVWDVEIVIGKFLAAWALIGVALIPTLLYYITVASLGDLDSGPVLGGYLGLMLTAGVYIAIGMFASSLTENQVVALILGIAFVLVLFFFDKVLIYFPDWMATTIEFLGIDYHYSNIERGIIDSRDIIYFLSALGFALYLTVVSLERRKW